MLKLNLAYCSSYVVFIVFYSYY